MVLIGYHIDLNNINNLNNNIKLIQIFIDSNMNKNKIDNIKKILKNNNIKLIVHSSYTINIAEDWNEYSPWIKQLYYEIEIAEYLNAYGIVIHLGKQLKKTKEQALNNMYSSINFIYNKIKKFNIKILFETSTGQGSELGYNLEDFAYFFKKFLKIDKNKFRICIDTCHIFQAGYNIINKKNIDNYFSNFDKLIGIKYIGLLHLNDSKNKLAMKKDRHENIGEGFIGKKPLFYIANFFNKLNIPIILETPNIIKTTNIIYELL
jgi:deoxyribonuclease-4